jgi:hypothetical protein
MEHVQDKKSTDEGSEIILVSRRKKKGKSATLFGKSTCWMLLTLCLSVSYFFYATSRFGDKLADFATLRVFSWLITNMEVGAYLFDSTFKTGVNDPSDTFFNQPALAISKFSFSQVRIYMVNSTKNVVTSFDSHPEIESIYQRTYISDYCDYYDEIKADHLIGMEKIPC